MAAHPSIEYGVSPPCYYGSLGGRPRGAESAKPDLVFNRVERELRTTALEPPSRLAVASVQSTQLRQQQGAVTACSWRARTLDLDILRFTATCSFNSSELTLPHPTAAGAPLVVVPLAEIARLN